MFFSHPGEYLPVLRFGRGLRSPPRERRAPLPLQGLQKDFTITSGTLFASHKLPLRGYLAAKPNVTRTR